MYVRLSDMLVLDAKLYLPQVQDILKYLFPVPKEDSKRVLTFINHDDYILFRHHTYRRAEGGGRELQLSEAGPRFLLKRESIRR